MEYIIAFCVIFLFKSRFWRIERQSAVKGLQIFSGMRLQKSGHVVYRRTY
jgi:hypothetical protein